MRVEWEGKRQDEGGREEMESRRRRLEGRERERQVPFRRLSKPVLWRTRHGRGHGKGHVVGPYTSVFYCAPGTRQEHVKLSTAPGEEPAIVKPYPDLAWLQLTFNFTTGEGIVSAIARLIPNAQDGVWRAYTLFTNLEGLKGHPPAIGRLRDTTHYPGTWSGMREKEREFKDTPDGPSVLIIGAGQSGLDVAARLKYLGVPTLLVERNERVGDQWRGRYESLCLHDPVWYDHMPYLPFPPGWPVWTPAPKLADWLESYAKSLDLNVWTSSTISSTEWDESAKRWNVTVVRGKDEPRVLHPRHVVVAIGLAGGVPYIPEIPGQDKFKGLALHSTSFASGSKFVGKKVLVIGACTSAHDISAELRSYGVDVTIYQRSSTYVMGADTGFPVVHKDLYVEGGPTADRGDRLLNSFPNHLLALLHQRVTKEIRALDIEIIQALERVGFQCNDGPEGTGFWLNALSRGGGYYLDVGTSAKIASGDIKLVSGTKLTELTETGAKFEDGRTVDADVVVYATGFGDFKLALRKIFSEDVVKQTKQFWGINPEGEISGVWRGSGHPGLYVMMVDAHATAIRQPPDVSLPLESRCSSHQGLGGGGEHRSVPEVEVQPTTISAHVRGAIAPDPPVLLRVSSSLSLLPLEMGRSERKDGYQKIAWGSDHVTGYFLSVYDTRLSYEAGITPSVLATIEKVDGTQGGCYFDLHTGPVGMGHQVDVKTLVVFWRKFGVGEGDYVSARNAESTLALLSEKHETISLDRELRYNERKGGILVLLAMNALAYICATDETTGSYAAGLYRTHREKGEDLTIVLSGAGPITPATRQVVEHVISLLKAAADDPRLFSTLSTDLFVYFLITGFDKWRRRAYVCRPDGVRERLGGDDLNLFNTVVQHLEVLRSYATAFKDPQSSDDARTFARTKLFAASAVLDEMLQDNRFQYLRDSTDCSDLDSLCLMIVRKWKISRDAFEKLMTAADFSVSYFALNLLGNYRCAAYLTSLVYRFSMYFRGDSPKVVFCPSIERTVSIDAESARRAHSDRSRVLRNTALCTRSERIATGFPHAVPNLLESLLSATSESSGAVLVPAYNKSHHHYVLRRLGSKAMTWPNIEFQYVGTTGVFEFPWFSPNLQKSYEVLHKFLPTATGDNLAHLLEALYEWREIGNMDLERIFAKVAEMREQRATEGVMLHIGFGHRVGVETLVAFRGKFGASKEDSWASWNLSYELIDDLLISDKHVKLPHFLHWFSGVCYARQK
ncbi:hypothetical protein EXIGLDRAFT_695199 [Exidia glandulosa HHB12029]|uniref:FAD/NAD(P)-binding domain-containing protein n=1 Tax=Exidia glandulosa HHB12029 TaxID=1314781 RepID=A0A165NG95_EXIGL|nr:hypothetical protein EXIGLDRAFT_695199 [Exidia glandulosa HHB12029]